MYRPLIAAAVLLAAAPAAAIELPARKAGLWELKMAIEGRNQPHSIQQCVDAATDQMMNAGVAGVAKQNCSKQDMRNDGGVITIDSVCTVGGRTNTSRVTISGSFDKAYTMKVVSTTEGAAKAGAGASIPAGQSNISIEATWLGPCKAGQKPGDMVLPGGITMNVKSLQGMIPGLMGPPR